MDKDTIKLWDVVSETLAAIAMCAYIGLQIYYKSLYFADTRWFSYDMLFVPLLYIGMLVLQRYPEFLNGMHSEPLTGKVRFYALRMLRSCKLLIMVGILIPAIADVWGIYVNEAFSLFLIVGLLVVIGYYMYRIYMYNKSQNK